MVPESTINQAVSGVRKIKANKQRDKKREERKRKVNDDLNRLDDVNIIAAAGRDGEQWMMVQYKSGYIVRNVSPARYDDEVGNWTVCKTGNYNYAVKMLQKYAKNNHICWFEFTEDCLRREND
jgi:hypothetical protein